MQIKNNGAIPPVSGHAKPISMPLRTDNPTNFNFCISTKVVIN